MLNNPVAWINGIVISAFPFESSVSSRASRAWRMEGCCPRLSSLHQPSEGCNCRRAFRLAPDRFDRGWLLEYGLRGRRGRVGIHFTHWGNSVSIRKYVLQGATSMIAKPWGGGVIERVIGTCLVLDEPM